MIIKMLLCEVKYMRVKINKYLIYKNYVNYKLSKVKANV